MGYSESHIASRAAFHSFRTDEPVTVKLEKLGWSWEISRDTWRLSGPRETSQKALEIALELVDRPLVTEEEVDLQTALLGSDMTVAESVACSVFSQLKPSKLEKPELVNAAHETYCSRNAMIVLQGFRENNSTLMQFTRRFGSPKREDSRKASASAEVPSSALNTESLKREGNSVFALVRGPKVDSLEAGEFVMLQEVLSSGRCLRGALFDILRHEKGLAYYIYTGCEQLDGNLWLWVCIPRPMNPEGVEHALAEWFSSIRNGDKSLEPASELLKQLRGLRADCLPFSFASAGTADSLLLNSRERGGSTDATVRFIKNFQLLRSSPIR
ncbi:MAG: hypothetical protein Kow00107_00390 [Planctomycetota bacterium]